MPKSTSQRAHAAEPIVPWAGVDAGDARDQEVGAAQVELRVERDRERRGGHVRVAHARGEQAHVVGIAAQRRALGQQAGHRHLLLELQRLDPRLRLGLEHRDDQHLQRARCGGLGLRLCGGMAGGERSREQQAANERLRKSMCHRATLAAARVFAAVGCFAQACRNAIVTAASFASASPLANSAPTSVLNSSAPARSLRLRNEM